MRRERVRHRAAVLLLTGAMAGALVVLTAGCTGASPTTSATRASVPARSSAPVTAASTPASPSTTTAPTPLAAGPTTSATAPRCPFVATGFVQHTMGMRLGRLTVQHAGGRVVGCRFYALQGGALHSSEHLPGPDQPAVEIVTTRYANATDAHNAFVLLAERGTSPTQADVGGGRVAVCFQDDFDPHDRGRDWSCAISSGATELVVRSVDTTGTFNTAAVTRAVLGAL